MINCYWMRRGTVEHPNTSTINRSACVSDNKLVGIQCDILFIFKGTTLTLLVSIWTHLSPWLYELTRVTFFGMCWTHPLIKKASVHVQEQQPEIRKYIHTTSSQPKHQRYCNEGSQNDPAQSEKSRNHNISYPQIRGSTSRHTNMLGITRAPSTCSAPKE